VGTATAATFGVVLGNTSNFVVTASGSNSVDILSTIDQANSGSSVTLLGNGSATATGGLMELGGTNRFTGGITIGESNGSQAGVLQIDAPYAIPNTGNVTIYGNSQLALAATGTYGALGQTLVLNGVGTVANSGAVRVTGPGIAWQGSTSLGSNTIISVTTSNDFTFSGAVTDNGYQLQKQGAGVLILSGNSNNLTGSTDIGNGTVTVNSGSSLGSGALQMAQTSTNNTALNLNNATQTIGALSSSFAATTGTETQVITLNSTALTINQTGATSFGLGTNSATTSHTSTITGSGSVTLGASSTGVLTLTGTQTYTGGTQIKAGTLFVDGAINGSTGTVGMTGGTLGGSGTLGGLVTVSSGVITAGSAAATIGELTLQTGLNLSGSGTYAWDLGSSLKDNSNGTAGSDFDQLLLTGGTLTLGGSSELTLGFLGADPDSVNPFWESNHSWTIINSTGATAIGNFSAITNGAYSDGAFSTTANGSGVVTLTYQAVPEPSTLAAFALGAASLLAMRSRRRK
jgi:autotransporter-associated beta strand protein